MINGVHLLLYSNDPVADQAALNDVLASVSVPAGDERRSSRCLPRRLPLMAVPPISRSVTQAMICSVQSCTSCATTSMQLSRAEDQGASPHRNREHRVRNQDDDRLAKRR